ncbi:EthD domain-containing protein [Spongiibacter sp. KMU-166]|uniref:EthD domain-containing protein n=1 Tax=Spongiibacter thalassae TaxID=2721624 RepID=A0ABX1GA53_9GAMM|nr:EthD domain-containing protein [Spongiibacter thalassae]NKI15836.1 EthD domain-containing protein [Spongiibacter thalassae]
MKLIKLVYCIHRNPSLTRDQFHAYWLDKHAQLVKQYAEFLGAFRYVQSHAINSRAADAMRKQRGIESKSYDGITEFWFRVDKQAAKNASPIDQDKIDHIQQRLIDDERNFIDFSSSSLFITEEHEIYRLD